MMKTLKEYIIESLLDDEDDIITAGDKILFDPIRWLYEASLNCRNWNQLLDVIKEFKEVLDIKDNAVELPPKFPREKFGVYSRFWEPRIYRFTNRDLLCRIDSDLVEDQEDSIQRVVTIGYGKTESIQLEWNHNKPKWRICRDKDFMNNIIKYEHYIYRIKSNSPIVSSYDAMMKEFIK